MTLREWEKERESERVSESEREKNMSDQWRSWSGSWCGV